MQSGGPAVQFEELKCGFVFKVEAWESWSPKLFCPLLPSLLCHQEQKQIGQTAFLLLACIK